jgi:diguanylate cyclase (GGDEF)-like protein
MALIVAGAVAAILTAVFLLGQYSLGKMLSREAVGTAELWYGATLGEKRQAVGTAIEATEPERLAHSLSVAGLDAVLVIGEDGSVRRVGPEAPGAEDDLREVLAPQLAASGDLFSIESGAYSTDRVGWLSMRPFRNWVLFPVADGSVERLAVRVEQSGSAAALVDSFMREVLISGGIAVITFVSFMAGFSYRQRQLAAENAAIRYLALHDELTSLPNRKQFEEFMVASLKTGVEESHKSALFVLDLDGFKSVNDTLGHPVGDGLLKAAAKRLKGSLRGNDLLARLSGDEFAIVVPKVSDPAMLTPLAERVLKLLATPFRVDGHEIQVGCSIGLAVAPDNGTDIDMLMRNADFALYRAKSEGRQTWRFFDPKMAEDLASRRTLEDGLRIALEQDHFQLLYQPQIDLESGLTTGYEAVLRWRLPGKGLVPAAVFMSIAEETGLVVPIGEWVIRQVARDAALLPADRSIAINLSATQLKRDGIDTFICETLKSHRVDAQRIQIEITESIMGRNEAAAFERLEKIRADGMSVVLDSFGMGTLNLGLLSRYTFDKLKVDRSFLAQDHQKSCAVLAAICSLGRSLGFQVAGQGVESAEHAQLLRAAGCSEAQGYYFAPPMPLESLIQLEAEKNMPTAATA